MSDFWKRKLAAYLHDSPDKVISIVDHEGRAKSLASPHGFQPEQIARKQADFAASAADRLPWPKSKLGDVVLCRSDFDATDKALRHPLGRGAIQFDKPFTTADEAFTVSHQSHPRIADDDPRAAFITVWRFWQNWAASADQRFACLPAETRLPDHTIWNHLAVTSALQGCFGGSLKDWVDAEQQRRQPPPPPDKPAFLLFTIGPVQDFIAAARNTRDLWSGSYLLSYLIGSALARISLDFGPDHVLFPNLLNQPILDLLLRRELWDQNRTASGEDLWRAFGYYHQHGKQRLLTPSLPNRFLAVLPSAMTEHDAWRNADTAHRKGAVRYAAHLEKLVHNRLSEIAASVSDHVQQHVSDFNRQRFESQISRLLEVHWQVLPWPDRIEDAQAISAHLPGEDGKHPLDSFRAVLAMLDRMPTDHRDPQYFRDRNVGEEHRAGSLAQISNAWSALYALAAWQIDAVKTTRAFQAWSTGGWRVGRLENKDSLNGKEETCLDVPNDSEEAKVLSKKLADGNEHVFKPGDHLGASTLIKRLWHLTWLSKKHPFVPSEGDFAMPNIRSIAAHQPFAGNADDDSGSDDEAKYFAVLALDGDEMGKWISGLKSPELEGQLSKEAADYFRSHRNADFLKSRRPLSPSFHLQFSELLANFGLHCVRRIVEAHDGRLIYSGGDDVLALLPADTAIPCARALRAAFRGEKRLMELAKGVVDRNPRKRPEDLKSDRSSPLFVVKHPGFIQLTEQAAPQGSGAKAGLLDEPVKFPFLVPGPAADCSVGIAIAHFKDPLQDVVRAAQAAEKRAKNELGRSAVAVTLMKRSGETIEWGCQWDSGGLEAYDAIVGAMQAGAVSGKFPHRIVELLDGYLTETSALAAKSLEPLVDFPVVDVALREFRHAIDRQGQRKEAREFSSLLALLNDKPEATGALVRFLRHAKGNAEKAVENAKRDRWGALRPDERHRLERAPLESPIQALMGLCRTVAFIARNLPDADSGALQPAISNLQSEIREPAERQPVP